MKTFLSGPALLGVLFWGLLFVPLIACSTTPEGKAPLVADDLLERGIVMGFMTRQRVGGALGSFDDFASHKFLIEDVASGKRIEHLGAGYFQLLLPPGDYVLTKITVAYGDLQPKGEPFRFTVAAGTVKYVGSVVTKLDAPTEMLLSRRTYVLGRERLADKGFRRRRVPSMSRSEPITLSVVDAQAAVEAVFRQRNPDLAAVPIILDPMR